jgi:hypothetical protein
MNIEQLVNMITHLRLLRMLKMCGALPALPLYAFKAWSWCKYSFRVKSRMLNKETQEFDSWQYSRQSMF